MTIVAGVMFRSFVGCTFGLSSNTGATIFSSRTFDTDVSPTLTVTTQSFAGSTGVPQLWFGADTSAVAVGVHHGATLTTDRHYVLAGRYGAPGGFDGLRVWVDGDSQAQVGTQAGSFSDNWASAGRIGGHGQWPIGGGAQSPTEFSFFYIFDRALSDAEVVSLSRNPWQALAPAPRRLWGVAAASGIPTLSAASVTAITATTARPQVTVTF